MFLGESNGSTASWRPLANGAFLARRGEVGRGCRQRARRGGCPPVWVHGQGCCCPQSFQARWGGAAINHLRLLLCSVLAVSATTTTTTLLGPYIGQKRARRSCSGGACPAALTYSGVRKPAGAAALRMPRLLRSEPSGALLLHSPYLVLVGAVVFVVFFLLGSLGRGTPARPPAAEADNTIASIS